jgi:hypothetical protein
LSPKAKVGSAKGTLSQSLRRVLPKAKRQGMGADPVSIAHQRYSITRGLLYHLGVRAQGLPHHLGMYPVGEGGGTKYTLQEKAKSQSVEENAPRGEMLQYRGKCLLMVQSNMVPMCCCFNDAMHWGDVSPKAVVSCPPKVDVSYHSRSTQRCKRRHAHDGAGVDISH